MASGPGNDRARVVQALLLSEPGTAVPHHHGNGRGRSGSPGYAGTAAPPTTARASAFSPLGPEHTCLPFLPRFTDNGHHERLASLAGRDRFDQQKARQS